MFFNKRGRAIASFFLYNLAMEIYKCPVCNNSLHLEGKTYKCSKNHSYDIAKKGYVNLLLANQGNHFLEEGDKKESVESRTRLLNNGAYSFLRDELIKIIKEVDPKTFCDLACGEGYYTTGIHKEINAETYGVDISKSAINGASTRKNVEGLKNIYFSIGNLDYLPFMESSFDCMLNCFAPIVEEEFARIAKKDAAYIRVLPGKNHLLEMKEILYENVRLNEPKEEVLKGFDLMEKKTISKQANLTNQQLRDLFVMTPYAFKTSKDAIERLFNRESIFMTLEFNLFIYKRM